MLTHEIVEFINRRFKTDCNWKTGNCYYFAVILADRFKQHNPQLYYDVINGHFLTNIGNVFYDWGGAVSYSDEFTSKYVKKWQDLYNEDPIWGDRIIRDVIL